MQDSKFDTIVAVLRIAGKLDRYIADYDNRQHTKEEPDKATAYEMLAILEDAARAISRIGID